MISPIMMKGLATIIVLTTLAIASVQTDMNCHKTRGLKSFNVE